MVRPSIKQEQLSRKSSVIVASTYEEYKKIDSLAFDSFKLRLESKGNGLSQILLHLMEKNSLWEASEIDEVRFRRLALAI